MCEHVRQAVVEGVYVCIDCGFETDDVVYITSYNRNFTFRRAPVYSRQKRFMLFVRSLGHRVLFERENDVLDVFGKLEFLFNMGYKFDRTYFFNRHVCLAFILNELEIPLVTKTLKDECRVQQQLAEMRQILENSLP
jgi:hypothetical protein